MKNLKLHYASAVNWMWNYCIYLGPFTDSEGNNFDLGIHDDSAAIVYGNNPGDYISGELNLFGKPGSHSYEAYEETRKRAKSLNLFK